MSEDSTRDGYEAWGMFGRDPMGRFDDEPASANTPVVRCDACGADLTPTPEQIEALIKFGNPLRRPPCLKTENGLHRVSQEQVEQVKEDAWTS